MTDECISPLRRRMIEDMTVRNFVVKTQTDYIRRVKSFAVFLGRSPDTATREDVRRYLLHLASSGMSAATVNGTGSALRFLFDITLDRPDIVRHLPVAREPRKAPVILSPEEVARMLAAAPGVKYKAALSVAYGAGLRVSEVVALKVSDIDNARMMIRIDQSKRYHVKLGFKVEAPRVYPDLDCPWMANPGQLLIEFEMSGYLGLTETEHHIEHLGLARKGNVHAGADRRGGENSIVGFR